MPTEAHSSVLPPKYDEKKSIASLELVAAAIAIISLPNKVCTEKMQIKLAI
jgi:hypothetical protein